MIIRSIYGETPEGAVPVEDRGPNREKYEKYFVDQSKLGWLRRHPRKASQQYEGLNKKETLRCVEFNSSECYFSGIYVPT
ncbi:hypothetical protein HMPREF2718_08315 [Staphylococcus sp. HMSC077C04]|nr:hypothetical protein HMPREF2718_08315 [Staphylococcus sp. HMSC077C04]OFP67718.1 hypothetical protein HMPREF2977_06125 [Staphylococcus sp. HMSC068G03]OHO78814.1 hypothetical protein HMPREF2624_10665 [Staphylococcus sp. HMSC055G07]OHP10291.1 hypothetical protein HMPREF2575_10195 [Staphylococcus sp. HMSC058E03]OHP17138.1 hypothetical protein HMPREF2679_10755 [Staphylococcus sp. HMSC060A04]OHS71541.1 hypothetical protein HMPREF3283_00815 [Staphylococcus sp. HMSC74A08]